MKYTMRYENHEIELFRCENALLAHCRNLADGEDIWQSPPCESAQELWWNVDKFFLWELELFPARQCPQRDQLRAEFMELAQRLEVTQ